MSQSAHSDSADAPRQRGRSLTWIILAAAAFVAVCGTIALVAIVRHLTPTSADDERSPAEPIVQVLPPTSQVDATPGERSAPAPEPVRLDIAIGKPVPSREAELAPIAGRGLAAYLRAPLQDDEDITSIAFSPDGTLLAAGRKGGLAVWDVAAGKRRALFRPSPAADQPVHSVTFSPDGTRLVGVAGGNVHLWSVNDGRHQRVIPEPTAVDATPFVVVRFVRDGAALVTLNAKGELRIWDAQSGASTCAVPELALEECDPAIAPDGKSVVFAAKSDHHLVHADMASGKVLQRWHAHEPGGRTSVEFGAGGKNVLSVSEKDLRLLLWDLAAPKPARVLAPMDGAPERLALSPGGSLAATVNAARGVEIHDVATGRMRARIQAIGPVGLRVGGLTFAPTGKAIAECAGKTIYVWDLDHCANESTIALKEDSHELAGAANGMFALRSPDQLVVYDTKDNAIKRTVPWTGGLFGLALDATGGRLAAGGEMVRVVDLARDAGRNAFSVGPNTTLAFSPNGQYLAGSNHSLIHLEINGKTRLLSGHRNKVRALAFSPDSRWLASGADDGKIIVWDTARQKKHWEADAHEESVRHLAFSGDGRLLASAGGQADPTISVWDLAGGTEKCTLQTAFSGGDLIGGILLSPDGKHVVVSHNAADLDVWDVAAGKLTTRLMGHGGTVRHMTALGANRFATSDNKHVLVWSWDKVAAVLPDYRIPADVPVALPPALVTMIRKFDGIENLRAVRFSPTTGLLALLTEKSCTVRNTASGDEVPCTIEHADITDAVFSPDGRLLATCGSDKAIKVWDLAKGELQKTLTGHTAPVRAVVFALGGKVLVSGAGTKDQGGELIFWDMPEGKQRQKITDAIPAIAALAATPDGKTVVAGCARGKIDVWNPANGARMAATEVEAIARALAVASSGKRLACNDASGRDRCHIWVWDLPAMKLVRKVPSDTCGALAFSPDGEMLLARSGSSLYVWDVAAGQKRYDLRGFHRKKTALGGEALGGETGVDVMAVSADGRLLATWSALDNALKLWNADNLFDQSLQKATAPFLAAGAQGRLEAGMLQLTLSIKGRRSAALLDRILALPYPVGLKLVASENLNDRDLGRLKGAKNLKWLDLEGAPWLGEEGLRQIGELTSLTSLALHSPRVNDQGLDHLRNLKQLRSLQLGDTDATPAGIERLQRALPKLDIGQ